MSPKPLTFSLSFSLTHFSFLDSQRSYDSAGDELIGAHEWETKPPKSIRDELELTWFSLTCQIDFPVLDLLFNGDNTDSTHFLSYSCTCVFCCTFEICYLKWGVYQLCVWWRRKCKGEWNIWTFKHDLVNFVKFGESFAENLWVSGY